ncbi:Aminoacylase-1 [Hondaea fermentalgiana]|uniref:N-acyl-aliphatic-L-amino acid amidohydrolase n=1 Tax=Hondaea fermentalgiana TaxID=2315210 RepID=A0A2R5GG12_9STRA|nr:Aminoacylase-1 [Hondaea fermentalgiana]|eukprot:GBG27573.1 Aminoacylase-1 [Hondaea fermentalgiana]
MAEHEEEEEEVEFFRDLLRFRTVSAEGPTGVYRDCAEWLASRIKELIPLASTKLVEAVEKKPVLVVEVRGEDPSLDAVLLHSHYDVVPAMEEHWDVDPWAAVEKDGRIYGRGTQDMKSVCAQYVLSMARAYRAALNRAGGDAAKVSHLFKRSVWLTFTPDEEIGSQDGMGAFVRDGHFDRIIGKVCIALDEGMANDAQDPACTVFYGERMPMWVLVKCEGPTGHGSRFIQNTAVEKLLTMANKAFTLRREQEALLGMTGSGCKHCEAKKLGDVLTINLTALQAGVSTDGGKSFSLNVIPTSATAGFDIRVPVTMPIKDVRKMLDDWCCEAGMSWMFDPRYGHDDRDIHAVWSFDESDELWATFKNATEKAGLKISREVFPVASDSRFLRVLGIPALGFSPMARTPILLHDHNEYLERSVFLEGIAAYDAIIPALANFEAST